MGRNLKPRHKASRRFNENVADTLRSPLDKRSYPSGQHGPKKSFSRVSEYGKQLLEKQKAKAIYGIMEKQFSLTFEKAKKLPGDLRYNILLVLETRLDNVIYRAGLAQTRRLARQLVSHGHFLIDGNKVDIPSYQVRPGQVIKVKDNKVKSAFWKNTLENIGKTEASAWLTLDKKTLAITVNSLPNEADMPKNIETHLIIEFYSR